MAGWEIGRWATFVVVAALLSACAPRLDGAEPAGGGAAAGLTPTRPSPLVFGNYCGYGRRYGDLSAPAVDRLDELCKAHDACYISGQDRCGCNDRLVAEIDRFVADGAPDRHTRRRAALVRAAVRAMTPYCRAFPHGLFPRRQDRLLATLRD